MGEGLSRREFLQMSAATLLTPQSMTAGGGKGRMNEKAGKREGGWYTHERIETARRNVARYGWAAEFRDRTVTVCKPWLRLSPANYIVLGYAAWWHQVFAESWPAAGGAIPPCLVDTTAAAADWGHDYACAGPGALRESGPNGPQAGFIGVRHNGGANYLFQDGHVKWLRAGRSNPTMWFPFNTAGITLERW